MESQPLSVPNAKLLSAATPGEMTILVRPHEMGKRIARGTFARAPVLGGAPREIAEDVTDADVTADGAKFALVRQTGRYFRLEFPAGTVLYESSGYLSNPRISPGGDRVAFFEHPTFPDDCGFVVVVENGKARRLTDEWATLQGLAWTPDGGELWFGAAIEADRSIYAVDLSGRQRIVWNGPVSVIIEDIARDGRVLVAQETNRYEIAGRQAGDPRDRGLNDFALEGLRALARDGTAFVSELYGVSGGQDYAAYLKKFDGSPAIRLGTGSPEDISPDGRWVATRLFSAPDRLVLLPPARATLACSNWGRCARRAPTFAGSLDRRRPSHPLHRHRGGLSLATYRIDVQGGPPQAMRPAGVTGSCFRRTAGRSSCATRPKVCGLSCRSGVIQRRLRRSVVSGPKPRFSGPATAAGCSCLSEAASRRRSCVSIRQPGSERSGKSRRRRCAGTGGSINVDITPDGGVVFNYERIRPVLYLVSGLR